MGDDRVIRDMFDRQELLSLPEDERALVRAGVTAASPLRPAIEDLLATTTTSQSRLRYAKDVAHLVRWMTDHEIAPLSATREDLEDYDASLSVYAPASQRRMRTVTRLLYRTLHEHGLWNESVDLRSTVSGQISSPADASTGFTDAEVRRLLDHVNLLIDNESIEIRMLAIRDRAILRFALVTGLRATEIVSLKRRDLVQLPDEQWVVQVPDDAGTGVIALPVDAETIAAVETYEHAMRALGVEITPDAPLWIRIGRHAHPAGAHEMTTRNLAKLVAKRADEANVGGPGKAVEHLRRTSARQALAAGRSVQDVARALRIGNTSSLRRRYATHPDA